MGTCVLCLSCSLGTPREGGRIPQRSLRDATSSDSQANCVLKEQDCCSSEYHRLQCPGTRASSHLSTPEGSIWGVSTEVSRVTPASTWDAGRLSLCLRRLVCKL